MIIRGKFSRPFIIRVGGPIIANKLRFTLNDNFTTALAAGSVNGTAAEPGPGTRTVVDVPVTWAITGGRLSWTNVGALLLTVSPRVAGKMVLSEYLANTAAGKANFGFHTAANFVTGGLYNRLGVISFVDSAAYVATNAIGAITNAISYKQCTIQRSTGYFYFTKGGTEYPNWTLLYISSTGTTNNMGPVINEQAAADGSSDFLRLPTALWLPIPLLSDGFGGTWPTSDGAGHAETTGLGSGGSGKTWTAALGTWGIAAGVASSSVLDASGISIAVATLPTADVFYSCVLGYSAGSAGVIVRYVDTANYTYAVNDGTNVKLFEVTTAVPYPGTERGTAVKAPAANARLIVGTSGAACRVYYNEALMFAYATLANTTAVKVGLITSNVNNTFNDAVAYAKGTGGEYSNLDRYARS